MRDYGEIAIYTVVLRRSQPCPAPACHGSENGSFNLVLREKKWDVLLLTHLPAERQKGIDPPGVRPALCYEANIRRDSHI